MLQVAYYASFSMFFYSSGKHKLDSVQLIYLAGARVVVNSNNICFRMPAADLLDHALAYNVVWQAAKGLNTHDVRYAAVDQLQLSPVRNQPSPV